VKDGVAVGCGVQRPRQLSCLVSLRWGAARSSRKEGKAGETLISGLIEDALKMPFTVFTTAQKERLLKWHHSLAGEGADGGGGGDDDSQSESASNAPRPYTCLDITTEGYMSLLDDSNGAVREDVKADVRTARSIRQSLADGREVVVALNPDDSVASVNAAAS
jgi:hypothetical protein